MSKFRRQYLDIYYTQSDEVCVQHRIFTYGRSNGKGKGKREFV